MAIEYKDNPTDIDDQILEELDNFHMETKKTTTKEDEKPSVVTWVLVFVPFATQRLGKIRLKLNKDNRLRILFVLYWGRSDLNYTEISMGSLMRN